METPVLEILNRDDLKQSLRCQVLVWDNLVLKSLGSHLYVKSA